MRRDRLRYDIGARVIVYEWMDIYTRMRISQRGRECLISTHRMTRCGRSWVRCPHPGSDQREDQIPTPQRPRRLRPPHTPRHHHTRGTDIPTSRRSRASVPGCFVRIT